MPLLRAERTWGPWRLGIALATAAAATWCYVIGESIGYYLNFVRGTLALTAGAMIGMLLVLLAAGPICIRFGIDSVASTKPQFGTRGWVIPASMQVISVVGWNSLLLIFFAKSVTQLLLTLGWLPPAINPGQVAPFATLVACAIVYFALLRGATGVSTVSKVLVLHVFVGLWMLYLLVSRRWPELLAAQPTAARVDTAWNYATGVELGISASLSWWSYLGAMVRMAPHGRTIAIPVMLGMGAPVPLLSMIGIAGVLVLKVSDPSEWLRTVGGPIYAVIALAFVAAANFGTAIAGVYASAIALRNFRGLERKPWTLVLLITVAPIALIGVLIPDLFFANFGAFLAYIGVAFAPLCGIQIADYYVLRARRIEIRGIFAPETKGVYGYWGGVNFAAVASLMTGCTAYIYLLNPLTYVSHGPYRLLTASLPSALLSGICHILLTRLIVAPRGLGGYPQVGINGSDATQRNIV